MKRPRVKGFRVVSTGAVNFYMDKWHKKNGPNCSERTLALQMKSPISLEFYMPRVFQRIANSFVILKLIVVTKQVLQKNLTASNLKQWLEMEDFMNV